MEITDIQNKIEELLSLYTETKDSVLIGYRINKKDPNVIIITCSDFDGIGKSIRHYEVILTDLLCTSPRELAEKMNRIYEEKMKEAEKKMKEKIRQMNIEYFIRTGKSLGIESETRKLIKNMYDLDVNLS